METIIGPVVAVNTHNTSVHTVNNPACTHTPPTQTLNQIKNNYCNINQSKVCKQHLLKLMNSLTQFEHHHGDQHRPLISGPNFSKLHGKAAEVSSQCTTMLSLHRFSIQDAAALHPD